MITVITGPPGAGKSTYLKQHARTGDITVDLDQIAVTLGSPHHHNHPRHIRAAAIAARHAAVELTIRLPGVTAWIIETAPSQAKRRWYYAKGARIVDLAAPPALINNRLQARRDHDQLEP